MSDDVVSAPPEADATPHDRSLRALPETGAAFDDPSLSAAAESGPAPIGAALDSAPPGAVHVRLLPALEARPSADLDAGLEAER